jgi:membrane-associated phospholipid phosphatase
MLTSLPSRHPMAAAAMAAMGALWSPLFLLHPTTKLITTLATLS